MKYFVLNTDAKSLPLSPHDLWFEKGLAITGGEAIYGKKLGRLDPEDVAFMYANKLGIVGVGRVLESWDGVVYDPPFVYLNPKLAEYRLRVLWFLDLRGTPVSPRALRALGLPSLRHAVRRLEGETGERLLRETRRQFLQIQGRLHSDGLELQLLQSDEDRNLYVEGQRVQVTANRYERDPAARRTCITHYGTRCVACGFSFGEFYGPEAEGYIHIHHLVPLSQVRADYVVDPIRDLRPLCPNCHAAVHIGVHITLR